jgi:hypothetical protein
MKTPSFCWALQAQGIAHSKTAADAAMISKFSSLP